MHGLPRLTLANNRMVTTRETPPRWRAEQPPASCGGGRPPPASIDRRQGGRREASTCLTSPPVTLTRKESRLAHGPYLKLRARSVGPVSLVSSLPGKTKQSSSSSLRRPSLALSVLNPSEFLEPSSSTRSLTLRASSATTAMKTKTTSRFVPAPKLRLPSLSPYYWIISVLRK
jgi:hypothetical protein